MPMPDAIAEQIDKLRTSLAALEGQRALLGDAVVEPALAALRTQINALEAQRDAQETRAPVEERRLITILFTDVVGSTALAEKLDPEEWRQTVAKLHVTVGDLIAQHQGQVAQYLGDGLLALFGAQQASEADAENAIRAALAATTAITQLNAGYPVQIRVGLHTGPVVVGELGAEAHKEFTATGDAMNLAARLQSAAPPGGILVSGDTYRYVRGVFDVTPQPPLTVKGKSEPVQTFLVRRAKPRPFRSVVRGVAGVETRTIGREREFHQLQEAYLDAYEHRRVVWTQLIGEPGVGKSRLLEDTREWVDLRLETVRLLRARAYAEDAKQPFALVRRMWFDRFQIAEDAPLAQAEAKWVQQFNAFLGQEQIEAAQALGLLVGLPFADSPYIGAMRNDPNQVKGRAFVVSRELLEAMRARDPLELLLEDLHLADASSVEYLVEVVWDGDQGGVTGDARRNGLFVLGTARPEWHRPIALSALAKPEEGARNQAPSAEVAARAAYLEMSLAPLSDEATRELAQEPLHNVEGVPDEVVALMVERSEGVPYFAEELVNYFLDRGIIDRSREPWRFVPQRLREAPLPSTLQHLLLTRLSALDDDERAALQRGAIFGRNFWTGGIQHLGARASGEVLTVLQPRGFVVAQPESSFAGEQEWSFHHNLLRDVTYESVLKRERARLHQKAAEWLEQQARQAGRLDEFVGLRGEQAERAGDLPAAADWFLRAGEHASSQGATGAARDYFDRALALLPPVEREQRWRALVGREAALAILGEHEAQQADLQALLVLADEGGDEGRRAEAWVRQQVALQRAGDYRGSLQAAEHALAAAEQAGDERIALRARAQQLLALVRLGEGKAARQLAEEVIGQARALGDDAALREGLGSAANVISQLGDPARGAELHQEPVEAARRSGDRFREATLLANLGYTYVQLGLYKQGRATLEQALAVDQALGARRTRAYDLQNLGLVYFRLGDGRGARQVLEESLRELAAVGDEFGRVATLQYLALEYERSGDYAGAVRRYQEAAEGLAKVGAPAFVQEARAGLARSAFGQGQLDEARAQVEALWQYLGAQGAGGMEFPLMAYLTCAELFDGLGEAEKAQAAADAGYRELMGRAEKISNLDWRQTFVEQVPEHHALVELWERLRAGQGKNEF
jgi:class 3 adenylate cyclase/tetratricopeptide (TPR) repeat protein